MKPTYQDLEPGYAPSIDHDQNYMQDWVIHYNIFTRAWNAVPRELYSQYWNNYDLEGVLRAVSLETLINLLHKCKGDLRNLKVA